ncbi:MAG TPA: sigma factor-like helix-turn-helix DNA-binding protein [Pyrinomonadaceae bacterium]|nr:sigma factor-like helix-turn-helix DNA-binding protein [Pyrinomonadaceae bacterium]
MKVGIQARLKNGILWEAAKKLGSATALARYLGLSPSEVVAWINFDRSPLSLKSRRSEEFWQDVENKLFTLTGHTLEEIFPPEIRTPAFLKRQKKIDAIVEMPTHVLIEAGACPQLPPMPDEAVFQHERSQLIDRVVSSLNKPRYEKLIKMRFGLPPYREHTLAEVADELGVSTGRVRQMESKALMQLRHPSRSAELERQIGKI